MLQDTHSNGNDRLFRLDSPALLALLLYSLLDLLQLLTLKLCELKDCIPLDMRDVLLRVQVEAGTPCHFSKDARKTHTQRNV